MPKNSTPAQRAQSLRKRIEETHDKLARTTPPAAREMLRVRVKRYEAALAEFPAHILRKTAGAAS